MRQNNKGEKAQMIRTLFKSKKLIALILFIILIVILLNIKPIAIKLMYQKKYSEHVEKYAQEYDIDSNLIYAIIKVESNFQPQITSSKGATGLMQLMDETAKEMATELEMYDYKQEDLYDPETNIRLRSSIF